MPSTLKNTIMGNLFYTRETVGYKGGMDEIKRLKARITTLKEEKKARGRRIAELNRYIHNMKAAKKKVAQKNLASFTEAHNWVGPIYLPDGRDLYLPANVLEDYLKPDSLKQLRESMLRFLEENEDF